MKSSKSRGTSETTFMLKLAAVACALSVAVIAISVLILRMPKEAESPEGVPAVEVSPVSEDLMAGIDPLETPEILETPEDQDGTLTEESDDEDDFPVVLSEEVIPRSPSIPRPIRPGKASSRTVVLIDKTKYKLSVLRDGSTVREYNIAVGKNSGDKERVGDMRTPEGEFRVQKFHDSAGWVHDFRDGNGSIRGAYGPLFIRLNTPPWSGIGIHGTHDPLSIG
ncbi:MAG: L,D-transpeptidase, partial [Synergistaceae bacterium]|nr:L,D-transpeptidase [Synergistaceae bacterium]